MNLSTASLNDSENTNVIFMRYLEGLKTFKSVDH